MMIFIGVVIGLVVGLGVGAVVVCYFANKLIVSLWR